MPMRELKVKNDNGKAFHKVDSTGCTQWNSNLAASIKENSYGFTTPQDWQGRRHVW